MNITSSCNKYVQVLESNNSKNDPSEDRVSLVESDVVTKAHALSVPLVGTAASVP